MEPVAGGTTTGAPEPAETPDEVTATPAARAAGLVVGPLVAAVLALATYVTFS